MQDSLDEQLAEVGALIKGARCWRGISRGALGRRVGLAENAIWRIETGKTCQIRNLFNVVRALGGHLRITVYMPRPEIKRRKNRRNGYL